MVCNVRKTNKQHFGKRIYVRSHVTNTGRRLLTPFLKTEVCPVFKMPFLFPLYILTLEDGRRTKLNRPKRKIIKKTAWCVNHNNSIISSYNILPVLTKEELFPYPVGAMFLIRIKISEDQKVSACACGTGKQPSRDSLQESISCVCTCARNATPCRLLGAQAQQFVASVVSEYTRTKPSELHYMDGAM